MQDTAADAGVWRLLDLSSWDMCSGGSPLVGLQLEDWSESDLISSNGSLTGVGCLGPSEQQTPHRGCQNPLPGALCAQQPTCQPPLGFSSIVDARDEVGLYLSSLGFAFGGKDVCPCAQASALLKCQVAEGQMQSLSGARRAGSYSAVNNMIPGISIQCSEHARCPAVHLCI